MAPDRDSKVSQMALAKNIQDPAKQLVWDVVKGNLSVRDIYRLAKLVKEVLELPEPVRGEFKNPNADVLMDFEDEFFAHLNIPNRYYEVLFRAFFKFITRKVGFDSFYDDLGSWALHTLPLRGWQFPDPCRPRNTGWHRIRPDIRARLDEAIRDALDIYQRNLTKLNEREWDNEELKQGNLDMRWHQFVDRILRATELEVELWRM
jgi:hypothetical protein